MKTLRIHLCPLAELGAESALDYDLLDATRAIVEHARAVPAALPSLPRTELVLAAPDVLLLDAQLPPLSGARLRAALPALAEPHLLADIASAEYLWGAVLDAMAEFGGRPVGLAALRILAEG